MIVTGQTQKGSMVVPFEVTVALPWRDYFVIVYSADERLDLACDSLWFYRTAIYKPDKHTSLLAHGNTSDDFVGVGMCSGKHGQANLPLKTLSMCDSTRMPTREMVRGLKKRVMN